MEYKPRTLNVGEKVYIVEYRNWGPNIYHVCTVEKVTHKGRIVLSRVEIKETLDDCHTKLAASQKAFDEIDTPTPDVKPIG